MQFSRGSIKALGAISGCLNKAIVAPGVSYRPISGSPPQPSLSRLAILLANLICLFPSPSPKRPSKGWRLPRGLSAPGRIGFH